MSDADVSSAAAPIDSSKLFKRKKRPQGRALSLRPASEGGSDLGTPREGTPGSGFEGDAEDSTSETLDSLLQLRRLKRSTAGLELDRLNAGERKKRPKTSAVKEDGGDGTVVREDGSVEGTKGGLRGAKDRIKDDGDAPAVQARKIVKSDNFTGQTNTVDVDKHMLAYIDAELARKRGTPTPAEQAAASKPHDPRDDLYRVADKYKFADVAELEKTKKDKDEDEGNVTLSASMLMGIPEVDLGIDTKLKNIEATEKAKRDLFEQQQQRRREAEEARGDEFAVDRFYRHRRPLESDTDALARARAEAARLADPANSDPDHALRGKGDRAYGSGKRSTATDEIAVARFKKRQQQQFK
ncbi:hypothetical protein JCM8547_003610 [Rhodosporidiobolus lusitaniae]